MRIFQGKKTPPTFVLSELVRQRSDFGLLCDLFGLRVGVEVGVDRGQFSYELLNRSTHLFLYMIDPWQPYAEIPVDRTEAKKAAYDVVEKYQGRYAIVECTSVAAANAVPAPIDFVYVDGAHDYANVKTDLTVWWARLRPGGVLAGHDFDTDSVRRAVTEFFNGHTVYVVYEIPDANVGNHPGYYVIKEF